MDDICLQAAAAGADSASVPIANLVHGKKKKGGKKDTEVMDLGGDGSKKSRPTARKRKTEGS